MKRAVCGVAGCDISVGIAVQSAGKKRVYRGCVFKPWTWLKFEYISVIEPLHADHAAAIGVITDVIRPGDQGVVVKLR